MVTSTEDINIEDYTGLAKAIAAKYVHLGVPFEDLLQEGMIGLLEAKERFDESREVAFSTYATFWVKKRILESINKENQVSANSIEYNEALDYREEMDVSDAAGSNSSETEDKEGTVSIPEDFPEDEQTVLNLHFNESKTLNEIASIMGISRERVRQLKQKGLRRMKLTIQPE